MLGFSLNIIGIRKEEQLHHEQLMLIQQSFDPQVEGALNHRHKLSLAGSLTSTEVEAFDGDPANYPNIVR